MQSNMPRCVCDLGFLNDSSSKEECYKDPSTILIKALVVFPISKIPTNVAATKIIKELLKHQGIVQETITISKIRYCVNMNFENPTINSRA